MSVRICLIFRTLVKNLKPYAALQVFILRLQLIVLAS